MSQRNKNNSIVFLTTLSVYFGLVLVGGTPSVSAQKLLQEKIEIVYLSDEKILAEYVSAFQTLFVLSKEVSLEHSEDLKALYGNQIKDGEYKFHSFHSINGDLSQTYKGASGDGKMLSSGKLHPSFEKLNKIFPHTTEEDKPQIKINLALTNKDFSLKVTAYQDSNEQAEQIFNSYTNELSRIRIQQADQFRIIYQNTEISRENNQIIIVTRLPRGSLDELLKQNAKAESK